MNSTLRIRIKVRGRLSARLANAFDGMTLVRRSGATELVGEVVDQAQLHGLLTRIRDLGLELEFVNVLGADPPDRQLKELICPASRTPTSTPKQRKGVNPWPFEQTNRTR